MKKILIISCIIGIISISMILNKSYNTYKEVNIGDNTVNIALSLDGSNINDVPSKGNYSVDVSCENATGKWDYSNWKLLVNNIKNSNIICSLDFTTVNPKDNYLNDKVTSLVGNGEVFNEEAGKGNYDNATTLTQNDYNNVSMYSSSNDYSTSGTVNTNSYSYSGTSWSSVPANLTSNTYYHIKFDVPSDGYYQFCYTMSSGSVDRLYLYKGTSNLNLGGSTYVSASFSSEKNGCHDIGYITTSDNLRVIQRTYNTIATVSFYLQKSNNVETVNAGIRYEGMNPNNYVWFNNELWRIIGVFDDTTHGVTGESLVKIIREELLGGFAWDSNGANNWATSSLMNLLNGAYLNQEDGTNENYCYGYSAISKVRCDYRKKGISDDYRDMIETRVVWKLGGIASYSNTASSFYLAERGTTVYNGNATMWPNSSGTSYPIGLMYMSDYGYAVPSSYCARTNDINNYDNESCTLNNWLYGVGDEWTLTHNMSRSYFVNYITSDGNLYAYLTDYGYGVRPVLYLKSSAWVISGDGSEANPFILGA